jgi:hypothetical protein
MSFSSPSAILTVASAGNISITQNDIPQTVPGSNFSATTAGTGLVLGYDTVGGGSPGQFDFLAFVVYNSALSAASQGTILANTYQSTGIQPQIRDTIVLTGSSISGGASTGNFSYPSGMFTGQLTTNFKRPMNFINAAYGGVTAANLATYSAAIAARSFQAGAANFVALDGCGSNDLGQSTSVTPSQVYSSYQSIASSYHSAGFKVGVSNILPRGGLFSGGVNAGSFETNREAFDALQVAGWPSYADTFIDIGDDPTIGGTNSTTAQTAYNNSLLYYSDKTHLTVPYGSSFMAAAYLRGLAPIVQ